MKQHLLLGSAILSLGLLTVGCDKKPAPETSAISTPVPEPVAKTKTLETSRLGSAVDRYEREPTPVSAAEVKKATADLDGEIAELDERVAKTTGSDREEAALKRKNLESYRRSETLRYSAAQAKSTVGIAPAVDGRTGGEKVEDSAKRVGEAIKDAAHETGAAIKDAVK